MKLLIWAKRRWWTARLTRMKEISSEDPTLASHAIGAFEFETSAPTTAAINDGFIWRIKFGFLLMSVVKEILVEVVVVEEGHKRRKVEKRLVFNWNPLFQFFALLDILTCVWLLLIANPDDLFHFIFYFIFLFMFGFICWSSQSDIPEYSSEICHCISFQWKD